MEKIIDLKLSELLVWTDNPRISYSRVDDEDTAMMLIYETVGQDKMLNLARDISQYGIHENKLPMVVYSDRTKKYEVYDGNRRVTILKHFATNNDLLKSIENKQGFANDSLVKVFVTDEMNALRIMEVDHSGENQGKGQIAWDAHERDNALEKLGLQCKYPLARQVTKICGLRFKKDFKKIPYTDLDSLYKSSEIKKIFDIDDWNFTNESFVVKSFETLKACKPSKPYSRYLTTLKNENEFNKFKDLVQNEMNPKEKKDTYQISLIKSSFYVNDTIPDNLVRVYKNHKLVKKTDKLIYIHNGNKYTEIDSRKVGSWSIKLKDVECNVSGLRILDYSKPEIVFNTKKIDDLSVNNSFELKELIFTAKNSKGENCISDIELEIINTDNLDFKESNSLFTYYEPGNVLLRAYYKDPITGFETDQNNPMIIKSIVFDAPNRQDSNEGFFLSRLTDSNVDFNQNINRVINQINRLYALGNYTEVIVASLRSVVESIIDFYESDGSIVLKKNGLSDKAKEIYELFNKKDFFEYIAKRNDVKIKFNDVKNIYTKNTLSDIGSMISFLHLGAHKSTKYVDEDDLKKQQSMISYFIEYSYFYLEMVKSDS